MCTATAHLVELGMEHGALCVQGTEQTETSSTLSWPHPMTVEEWAGSLGRERQKREVSDRSPAKARGSKEKRETFRKVDLGKRGVLCKCEPQTDSSEKAKQWTWGLSCTQEEDRK